MERLLNEHQAARFLNLSVATLRNDRSTRRRFPYLKLGKSVRYRFEDLQAVIESSRIGGNPR
ncbi:helix-turn-helix domain-containing protein [Syntrophobacter fumaroxidans]|uniref:helix-turn-helix domain-containing protein n=1 Tax=Syntrophobacter fumaroxidans TaxID=119484 RepID=UPI0002FE5E87|nr:helix-turn-helix domain-containing protein [Syntrophobacter fumaroxidans]